jgi:hypothetical protein
MNVEIRDFHQVDELNQALAHPGREILPCAGKKSVLPAPVRMTSTERLCINRFQFGANRFLRFYAALPRKTSKNDNFSQARTDVI